MTEILKQLNTLGNYTPVSSEQGSSLSTASAAAITATAKLSQVRCVLHLVNQLGARFELASPAVAAFVVKLLELAQQTITASTASGNSNAASRNVGLTKADHKHFTNTLSYLKSRATMAPAGNDILSRYWIKTFSRKTYIKTPSQYQYIPHATYQDILSDTSSQCTPFQYTLSLTNPRHSPNLIALSPPLSRHPFSGQWKQRRGCHDDQSKQRDGTC